MFTLGRKVDFNYKTNKIIVIAAAICGVIGWIATGNVRSGLTLGFSVFLTWALGRELDPNHDYSAFIALGLSLLNFVYYENIQLLVIVWLLLLIRLVNGITGKSPTIFDVVSALGFTVFLSMDNANSGYIVVFGLAMLCLIKLQVKPKLALAAGVIGLGLFIGQLFFMNYPVVNPILNINGLRIFASLLLVSSFMLFWFLSKADIKDDLGHPVKRSRILAGQMLFSGAGLILLIFDAVSFNNLVIYLSVILASWIYFLSEQVFKRKRVS